MIFDEGMKESTVTEPANFSLVDEDLEEIGGTLTYNDSAQTLTFAPSKPLKYDVTYTATATTGMTDYYDNPMDSDVSWSFTTGLQYPVFDEPTAVNNRIRPGGNDTVLIFIPEPPGGATDRVSVQVFTTTGRLVRTFHRNASYQSFSAGLPIEWDGTNGRGEPLGPGMYFIQIRATDYRRVLKVMIVR
jgi:hypothetical protein